MFLKIHISGDAIVYDSRPPKKKKLVLFDEQEQQEKAKGRPQGSLYGQQKRSIADACEFLRLYCQGNSERCAIVFTLTTPDGVAMDADLPKFISAWFENMRKNYGLGEYVWVREYTKRGIPHFHCVADWWSVPYWFASDITNRCSNIELVSMVWSRLFSSTSEGEASKNSVWLGGYWFGKRIYSLRSKAQCRYLTKYLGKRFTAKRVPMEAGNGLPFVRVKDYREVLQSVNNSLNNRRQENLRVRSQKRKKK